MDASKQHQWTDREEVFALMMFRGPQAYITPAWYPGKAEHGKVVSTWNCLAVNAHGTARVADARPGCWAC